MMPLFLFPTRLLLLALAVITSTSAQATSTSLLRRSLKHYPLALCNDGSAAAYYHSEPSGVSGGKYMIYLPDAGVDRVCVHSRECNKKCKDYPRTCSPPEEAVKQMEDGIWSQNIRNNPFAVYFKVYLPSCSSDEFSGIRGNSSGTEDLFFYGRHIFSSLLRDLVDYFNIANAEDVVLIGSGSGARGAARNCDFLAESIAKVNTAATIRCVLDGVDFVPYWVQSPNCFNDKHQIKESCCHSLYPNSISSR